MKPKQSLEKIWSIFEKVDNRAMAADGPVRPRDHISGKEFQEIADYVKQGLEDNSDQLKMGGIGQLQEAIYKITESKGFWEDGQNRNVGETLALIHSEISEALEAHRKNEVDDKLPHRNGVEVELADAVIRILDFAHGFGYDIEGAIEEKMEFNSKREYKHGKGY